MIKFDILSKKFNLIDDFVFISTIIDKVGENYDEYLILFSIIILYVYFASTLNND